MIITLTNLKGDASESNTQAQRITMGVNMGNFMLAFVGQNLIASNGVDSVQISLEDFKKLLTDNAPSFLVADKKF